MDHVKTLSRDQLYDLIWTKSLKHLSDELNVRISELIYVCDRHQVPRPKSGYWMKKQHGKDSPRPPLPDIDDAKLQTIDLHHAPIPPRYDDDILMLLERAEALPITVKTQMRSLHPLVAATQRGLLAGSPDNHDLISAVMRGDGAGINVSVSSAMISRAVCFLDALVKTFAKLGGSIQPWEDGYRSETHLHIAGEFVSTIRLRERYRQVEPVKHELSDAERFFQTRWDYVPSGVLVVDKGPQSTVLIEDCLKRDRKIEDYLAYLIRYFICMAGDARITRQKAEEAERRRQERTTVREAKRAVIQRERDELTAKQDQERERVETFFKEFEAWRHANEIREYIAAVRERIIEEHPSIEPHSDEAKWFEWANQQADRRDPLKPTPYSILDEPLPSFER